MKQLHPLVILGTIIGSSLIIVAVIGSITVFKIRAAADVISVTGSAKMQVTSDTAKWTTQISRTVSESALKNGYAQLANDLSLAKTFMAEQGITEDELVVGPINMSEVWQENKAVEKRYTLGQVLTVQSSDVAKITTASTRVSDIIGKGVLFTIFGLDYYYSALPEARIVLLSQAIEDAKTRAGEMAKSSGRTVGSLRSASSGVVQVQSLNSTDVSDYGSYDTSQIEKQITVTAKASFSLR